MKYPKISLASPKNSNSGPFVTSANYIPSIGQLFTMPSLTQPNASMSLAEIFKKFASGAPLPVVQGYVYPDLDTSDFDNLDRFEKLDRARQIADDLLIERKRILAAHRDQESANLQARIDEQIQRGIEDALRNPNVPPSNTNPNG